MCAIPGCGAALNKRDLVHHQSEVCEFRKVKCHSCEETTKTLANLEKKITNMEQKMEKKMMDMKKEMEKNMEGKFEIVNNEVRGLKTALVEKFDQVKDVLIKMEDNVKENARKVRNAPSGDRENIIVAGGSGNDSVEMFNWRQRTWSPLQSMPRKCREATSFVYNNQVVIAGGYCVGSGHVDDMIRMNVDPHPYLSKHWIECPMKLPATLNYHSSVLYNDTLIVTGGYDGNATSDRIHEVQVVPPYRPYQECQNRDSVTVRRYLMTVC